MKNIKNEKNFLGQFWSKISPFRKITKVSGVKILSRHHFRDLNDDKHFSKDLFIQYIVDKRLNEILIYHGIIFRNNSFY